MVIISPTSAERRPRAALTERTWHSGCRGPRVHAPVRLAVISEPCFYTFGFVFCILDTRLYIVVSCLGSLVPVLTRTT